MLNLREPYNCRGIHFTQLERIFWWSKSPTCFEAQNYNREQTYLKKKYQQKLLVKLMQLSNMHSLNIRAFTKNQKFIGANTPNLYVDIKKSDLVRHVSFVGWSFIWISCLHPDWENTWMSDSYPVSTMGSQWNKNHIQLMNFYTIGYGFFFPVTAHL